MQAARVIDILDEIGTLTKNPRIRELSLELGTLLAANFGDTAHNDAKLTRLQTNTTRAIVDTEATLEDRIVDLRTAVTSLTQLFRQRLTTVEDRSETITGRVHTLANHMMGVEQKVSELAEAITLLLEQTTENEDSFNIDDHPLDNPYDGNERS